MSAANDDSVRDDGRPAWRHLPARRTVLVGTLLLLVAIIAALAFRFGLPAYRQLQTIRSIERIGGIVGTRDHAPSWIRRCLGDVIKGFEEIHLVAIEGPGLTDADLLPLRELTELEELHLQSGIRLTDAALSHLSRPERLRSLFVKDTGIRGGGLARLKGLTALSIASPLFDDAGLIPVGGLKNLAALRLEGTLVGDAGLPHLQGLKNLSIVSLAGTRVTDDGIEHLGEWKSAPSIAILDLSETGVTAAGMGALTRLPKLSLLGLNGTSLDDESVSALKELRSLRSVQLNKTKVTRTGINDLLRTLNSNSRQARVSATPLIDRPPDPRPPD